MSATSAQLKWESYAKSPDAKAREQLLVEYLPLVRRVAGRVIMSLPRSVRLDDLISAGVVGLLSSVDNFDPQLGIKFETFAVNRIRGAMLDNLREMDWVPRSVRQKARHLDRTIEELTHKHGRVPNPSEVAETLGLSLEDYRKLLFDASAAILVSLDDALTSDHSESAVLSDLAADVATPSSQERIEDREQRSIIVQCLKELPDQEKLVLALYYYEELTFKEIGEVLNLTESRVSQIHSKAVAVLRTHVNTALSR
jgi:RNA polymerase sigma factor for flagellar operon FliA